MLFFSGREGELDDGSTGELAHSSPSGSVTQHNGSSSPASLNCDNTTATPPPAAMLHHHHQQVDDDVLVEEDEVVVTGTSGGTTAASHTSTLSSTPTHNINKRQREGRS